MRFRPGFALLALLSGVALADSPATRVDSLYARLGGAEKVAAFIDATIEHTAIAVDRRAVVRAQWIQQVCALSDGGCRAADRAPSALSAGVIEELRRAMRAQDVPLAARNELLELLAANPRDSASP